MEKISSYLTVEGSSSTNTSSDSLNGLKFGQKIYFEDVGGGGGGSAGGGGKSTVVTTTTDGGGAVRKGGKGVVQSGQPPRCQVEGCKVDLSDAKAYYSRHKVCGMHSKSSTVIVNGLEQRFCQQCSRFHQLPEFDQGKRSCRRRLAGHNERRRKPPPGSLLTSRLGRLSSSVFADNNRSGFLLDFSSYPRHSEKDLWLGSESSEQVSGSQSRSIIWPGNLEEHPSKMYLQGSASGSNFSYTSGECITGVSSDSSCALSLLSNQTWSSNNRSSGTGPGNPPNMGGECITGLSADSSCALSLLSNQTWASSNASSDTVTVAQFPSNGSSWGFKGGTGNDGANSGLHAVPSGHLGLGQFSQPHFSGHYHGDLMMEPVHGGRQYMDVNSSRAYDSANTNLVDWSL